MICCHWLSPSIVNTVPLHLAVRFKHHRTVQNPSCSGGYCFPSGICCSEGSGLPEQDDCCLWGLAQHQIPTATISVLSPNSPSPVSLIHSAPLLVVVYCLWLFLLVVYLVTRTQQSGSSTKGPGQRPSWGQGYCFPSGCCCSEGIGLPEQDGCCYRGDDSALDLGSYFLSSLPKASVPSLFTSLSSPLCPSFASDLLSLGVSLGCLSGH